MYDWWLRSYDGSGLYRSNRLRRNYIWLRLRSRRCDYGLRRCHYRLWPRQRSNRCWPNVDIRSGRRRWNNYIDRSGYVISLNIIDIIDNSRSRYNIDFN